MSQTIDQAVQIALQHHQANRLREAEGIYRRILYKAPNHSVALHYLGVLSHQLGQHRDGIDLIKRSLDAHPCSSYYNNLGEVYRAARQFDQAGAAFSKAVELDPHNASARNNLGAFLLFRGQYQAAQKELEKAIELDPRNAQACNNLGNVFQRTGRFNCAETMFKRAIELNPRLSPAYANLSTLFSATGRLPEAFDCSEKLLKLSPADPAAHLLSANLHLLTGQFQRGWEEYEWRFRGSQNLSRSSDKPRWTGQDPAGKRILLHAEQGFGDTIQFIRYVPIIESLGAQVIVECQAELIDLFTGVGGADLFPAGGADHSFDYIVPLLSVPLALQGRFAAIPNCVPYLQPDPARKEKFRNYIRKDSARLRCGLVWAGRPTHEKDRERSCNLAQLQPLAALKDVIFYSLQKGEAAAEANDDQNNLHLVDLTGELHDFADTAALIANLDLVLSVDTAPAHLAGALGKPVWVMLAFAADWRWMLDRDDSPWYPTMRLFRQKNPGDWNELVQRVVHAMAHYVKS